jgi:ABC-type sugar transport system ATPase subunit
MTMTDVPDHARAITGQMSIELIEVTKRYGDHTAVNSVDLTIPGGKFTVLLGPSGCGKSTLLRMIAGIETVTSGEVYIGGQLANYLRPKSRNVAMVFQNYALYPHMTVQENIGFPLTTGRGRHQRKAVVEERVREVAEFVELADQLHKYPDQLSGGQRQRVALARAVIREPGAYLMDEPLSNLDALLRVQMRTELLKLHRRVARTFVYVTHDQTEAMTMADQVVVMRNGVVQQIGAPEDLYNAPANTFVATFIGAPQMNVFDGILTDHHGARTFTCDTPISVDALLPADMPPGNMSIGVRSEDILVCASSDEGAIPGMVDLAETIGPDTYLTVDLAGSRPVTVRVATDDKVAEGEAIALKFRPGRVHFFDAKQERFNR